MLALNSRDIAGRSVGKVPSHDNHLRIVDDIASEQTVRCSRAWLIGIPFNPFESRHCEDIHIVESLEVIHNVITQAEMVPTVAFSPNPNPPYM